MFLEYIYIYIIHTYVHILHIFAFIHVHIQSCLYVHIHTYVFYFKVGNYLGPNQCLYIRLYIYICTYVLGIYIYIYIIHTYVHALQGVVKPCRWQRTSPAQSQAGCAAGYFPGAFMGSPKSGFQQQRLGSTHHSLPQSGSPGKLDKTLTDFMKFNEIL